MRPTDSIRDGLFGFINVVAGVGYGAMAAWSVGARAHPLAFFAGGLFLSVGIGINDYLRARRS